MEYFVTAKAVRSEGDMIVRDHRHLIVRRDLLENFLAQNHSGTKGKAISVLGDFPAVASSGPSKAREPLGAG